MLRPLLRARSTRSSRLRAREDPYDEHVFLIFEQACLNCHNPDKTKGGLDLSSFSATLKGSSGGKIDEPGATLDALQAIIAREAKSLHATENELTRIGRAIDPSAQLAHDTQQATRNLKQAYHKALE